MKTSIKVSSTVLFMCLLSYGADAQFINNQKAIDSLSGNTPAAQLKTGNQVTFKPANPKVVRSFAAHFPAAINQRWIRDASVFHVSFINQGNKASAVFSCNGQLNYAITCLKASDIPVELLHKIQALYPSYSVFSVKKVMADDTDEYEIILENALQFLPVTISGNIIVKGRKLLK
jgi:hypothetical protein